MTKGQKIGCGICLGVPLLCCLGGYGLLQGTFGSAGRTRDREVAAARAAGIPTTPAELDRTLDVPANENAYPVYVKLLDLIADGKPEHKDMEALGNALGKKATTQQLDDAKEAFPRLQTALALAHEAATYPHLVFPHDWSRGWNELFPEFASMKGVAKILVYDARQRSDAGDWKGALADIKDAQVVSRHAASSPILIGMLVQLAIEAISNRSLDEVIDKHSHDPAFLAAAQKVHDGFGPLADYRHAMFGEVVMGRAGIAHMRSIRELTGGFGDDNGESNKPNGAETAFFSSNMVRTAFDAKLVEAYRRLITSLPMDTSDWEGAEKASEAAGKFIENDHSLANMLNQILFPVFTQATEAVGVMQTHRRLTATTLRLLQDRNRTGSLPKYLPKYGEICQDPFSPNPLIYHVKGKGFILYSIGRDRIDNGGTPSGTGTSGGYDEVVEIH